MQDQLVDVAAPRRDGDRAGRTPFVAPILAAYLLSRLLLLPVVYGEHLTASQFARLWDGRYYLQIAAHGYPSFLANHGGSVVAFFPLYSLLVRGAAPVFGDNWALSGIVVSFLTGAVACLAVGALARERAGTGAGVRAGWLLAFAPGAAFLSFAYAEGLAISLCAVTLIMLDRRRWLAAGLIGALATAASSLALPIVAAAAWAAWRAGQRRAWIAPVLATSGFASYCLFLWARIGTPFGWFDAERIGWHAHVDPWSPVRWFLAAPGTALVETLCLVVAAGGLWAMRRARVPGTWWVFVLLFLTSIVTDSAAWMTPRFLLSAFPLVAAAAIALRGERFRVLVVSSGIFMVLALVAYTSFGFVYRP